MPVDNALIIRPFVPVNEDLGQFIYTELLDRTRRVGNNGVRIVKTFFHRCPEDFDKHLPQMKKLCDATGARAYTRLSSRSFERVGKLYTKMVVEAAMSENWAGMKTLYSRACGVVTPEIKLWLFDVDEPSESTRQFGNFLAQRNLLKAIVPSKRGLHYITPAFDLRTWDPSQDPGSLTIYGVGGMSLHKDNGTNLYIPDEAA